MLAAQCGRRFPSKQEEKEEKKKDYYLHERHIGYFERHFALPEGVDTDKIQASRMAYSR